MKNETKTLSRVEEPISNKRTVLYLTRSTSSTRKVVNEEEILDFFKKNLLPEYEFIVVQHTQEYQSIEGLHNSWRSFANIFARAKLIIGPHGTVIFFNCCCCIFILTFSF